MNKAKHVLFLFILLTSYFIYQFKPIGAQHFESDSYIIDWGNFNMTAGNKASTNYHLTDTVGQIAPGQYDNNSGYTIKSGFQYIYDSLFPFSFRIDNLTINFGTLVPNVGVTATNIITITSPSGRGYDVNVAQNHPLQINSIVQIPDFTGDNNIASETTSDTWNNATTYGFGFNAIGINSSGVATNIGTSQYFSDNTFFRQFANSSLSEPPQPIMSEASATRGSSALISYKARISPIQAAGEYENGINFIAIPKY